MPISALKASIAVFAALAAALVVAACGGGGGGGEAKSGGTLKILDTAGGIDSLDPGYWYYQSDYQEVFSTTQRALYGWKPQSTVPTPDLAQGLPWVSNGGKTLTIKIKSGIRYSPPLQNQTVKSADIKYAMERCFAASVGNGYAFSYYTDIVGAPPAPMTKVPDIGGIQTPDDSTLVLNLKKPVGVLTDANALGLPCTAPVPRSYAAKYDAGSQSTYGQHQVFTGPSMIQGAGSGTVPKSAYQPAKLLVLVRNPSWDGSTDFKPAYFDKDRRQERQRRDRCGSPGARRHQHGERRLRRAAAGDPEAGSDHSEGPVPGLPERRQPLPRALHDGQTVRQPQRVQGGGGRARPQRLAPDARRPSGGHNRQPLHPARDAGFRPGGRQGRPRLRLLQEPERRPGLAKS